MKKILLIILGLTFLNMTGNGQSKDEKSVAEAVETLRKTMIDPDKAVLENLASDLLTYGHSGGKVEDKASFVDTFVTGKSDFKSIEISEQTIQVVGSTAIVRHKFAGETFDKGVSGTVKLAILTVWMKEKGQWKLLARQAVKI
ncbi:protein of unknown function [Pseudarcicella hirudinis]|uniref:DUF4440 domain-containing protein n=1 Tax=Pseudarcicella hirudinis TaxID=1079859 RepID=A0A1I5XXA5_9BACT|nr:nuclear transport factor 2 family protein [Pseudarcicella hirudinis]SFQ36612.1 protein of unknown function [Pseudarcicella hirudinis]